MVLAENTGRRVTLAIALICLLGSSSWANEPVKITFEELKMADNVQNTRVKIRGFLYRAQDGRLVLSNQPNLKTCCVGVAHKGDTQLIVIGDITEFSSCRAVTLEGWLHVESGAVELRDAKIP